MENCFINVLLPVETFDSVENIVFKFKPYVKDINWKQRKPGVKIPLVYVFIPIAVLPLARSRRGKEKYVRSGKYLKEFSENETLFFVLFSPHVT